MITTPTVLVLGAGANYTYGFPLGAQLTQNIYITLKGSRGPGSDFVLLKDIGFSQSDIKDFADDLEKSNLPSIDTFVMRKPQFMDLAKYAIAIELVKYEHQAALLERGKWYFYLYNRMNNMPDKLINQKISFITFNYDRSLEQFLYLSLKHGNNNITDDQIKKIIDELSIIHVHGHIGFLPWQYSRPREYSNIRNTGIIKVAAENIKLIPENQEINSEFKQANDKLHLAERIYFLGFGFD